MTKTILIALASATFISTAATAGNLISPAQEPAIEPFPEFVEGDEGFLAGIKPGTAAGILGGLLVLGVIASSGGS